MNTLYHLLSVDRKAAAEQIDAAYRQQISALEKAEAPNGQEALNRMRILKDAYWILSDPARRRTYDAKLSAQETAVTYEVVVEQRQSPWIWVWLMGFLVIGGGYFYHEYRLKKEREAQLELAAKAAKIADDLAKVLSNMSQTTLARQAEARRKQAEAMREQAEANRAAQQAFTENARRGDDFQRAQREAAQQKTREDMVEMRNKQIEEERQKREAKQHARENAAWERAHGVPQF